MSTDNTDISLNEILDETQHPIESPKPDKPDEGGKGGDENKLDKPEPKPNSTDDKSEEEINKQRDQIKGLFARLNQETLSEEDTATKSKVLGVFKGKSFNEQGDILDENGEVVKTFEEVYKYLTSEEQYDKDGNLVDSEGNILRTKEELNSDKSGVNILHQELGYEFKDEKGNIKSYSDDKEGLKQLAVDIAKFEADKFQQSFINQNPVLIEVAKHLALGKDLSTFNQQVDYSKVDKANLSEEAKLNYIRKSFEDRGFSKERIDDNMRRIKDGNEIDKELDYALVDLQKSQTDAAAKRDAEYQAMVEAEEQRAEAYWDEVENVVKSGSLNNFNIPEPEKQAFFDYLSKPVKDGKSQATLDAEARSIKDELTLRFLGYKKFDLSKYISNAAKSQKANGLMDLILRSAQQPVDTTTSKSDKNKKTPETISINELLG